MFRFLTFSLPLCVTVFPDGLQYLTTVIPYEKKGHPPSIEDLQVLTKSKFPHLYQPWLEFRWLWLIDSLLSICCFSVLQAMRDDSDKVPSLLTDYILKGERLSFLSVHCGSWWCDKLVLYLQRRLYNDWSLVTGLITRSWRTTRGLTCFSAHLLQILCN